MTEDKVPSSQSSKSSVMYEEEKACSPVHTKDRCTLDGMDDQTYEKEVPCSSDTSSPRASPIVKRPTDNALGACSYSPYNN